MLAHTDLKKGVKIILEEQPYEILESSPMRKAQGRVTVQTKLKNLISGNVVEKNFQQADVLEEADISKFEAKFLYTHRDKYFFCEVTNPSTRFELDKKSVGEMAKFLKQNQIIDGVKFRDKIISIDLPIKIQLKVIDAPPGVRGDRAQGGTKSVILETGAIMNAPLFIQPGDIIEINTETGEYVRRVE